MTVKELINENDVCLYDGIITIIADVEWDDKSGMPTKWEAKEIFLDGEYDEPMTFLKVREMYPTSKSIRLICDKALKGEMYHYQYQGNGSYWVHYGTTMGYA